MRLPWELLVLQSFVLCLAGSVSFENFLISETAAVFHTAAEAGLLGAAAGRGERVGLRCWGLVPTGRSPAPRPVLCGSGH